MLELMISAIALALDQLSKFLIMYKLEIDQTVPIIKNIFHITYIHNTGIAFGIMNGSNYKILVIIVCLFLLAFFYLKNDLKSIYNENCHKFLFRIGVGLFFGGAFGNILDRFLRGFVIDFLDFRVWPIFNLADSFICIAFIIFVFIFLIQRKRLVQNK